MKLTPSQLEKFTQPTDAIVILSQKREYVRDEKGQFAVYHGTSVKAAEEILKHGILPVSEAEDAPPGFEGYFTRREGIGQGKAFVSTSEKVAISYAASRSDDDDDLVAVVVLKPEAAEMFTNLGRGQEALRRHPGSWGSASATEMGSEQAVPPEMIKEVRIYRNGDVQKAFAHPYSDWLSPLEGEIEPVTVRRPEEVRKREGQELFVAFVLPAPKRSAGIGGITRKFDAAAHPRGDDGRFIEASQPRIFNRPSDVGQYSSGWAGDAPRWAWINKETGKPGGHLLTGEPIPRDQIPAKLYHVTTNAPAVEASGVLLGLREDGGMGGGQAEGVSFTSSKEDAHVIQRELTRAVQVARGEVGIEAVTQWAREDEKEAGLSEGALNGAVEYAMQGWDVNSKSHLRRNDPPNPPEEEERIRRSLVDDALKAYLQTREEEAAKALGQKEWPYSVPILKNPILFGQQKHLAKIDPKNIQILETDAEDIPADALVTTGSDKFLHEVRVYADVPRKRKKAKEEFDEDKHPRNPSGSSEGGQFTETGRSGVPTSDPVLAVQAKAGIVAVEKLIPQAVKTADWSKVAGAWESLNEAEREKIRIAYFTLRRPLGSQQFRNSGQDFDLRHQVGIEIEMDQRNAIIEETQKRLAFDFKDILDPTTIQPNSAYMGEVGTPPLDWTVVRREDGTALTAEERRKINQAWTEHYNDVFGAAQETYHKSKEFQARRAALVEDSLREEWQALDPKEKVAQALKMRERGQLPTDIFNRLGTEPKQWVTGVETGTHNDEDYARTHAVAKRLTELRTDAIRKERGLLDESGAKPTYTIDKKVVYTKDVPKSWAEVDTDIKWNTFVQWRYDLSKKDPSIKPEYFAEDWAMMSDDEKLAELEKAARAGYTYAAKDSAGTIIAAGYTQEAVERSAEVWAQQQVVKRASVKSEDLIKSVWRQWISKSSEGLSLSLQLAAARELGGHHRMTPEEVQEAEREAQKYGGMETMQAYVRAQWEVNQLIMAKAGEDKISIYRGLQMPGEVIKGTTNLIVGQDGKPIAPPSNMKEVTSRTSNFVAGDAPHVAFDYNGEHFVIPRRELNHPSSWDEVDEEIKKKVRAEWEKNVKEVVAENVATDPGYTVEKGMGLFDRMSGAGKLQMLSDWRKEGRLPKVPYESMETAVQRRVDRYLEESATRNVTVKLPDLQLQRAGAASMTGTLQVANDWGGIPPLPPNPTRVVLRIEAPPTSVLSLPIYGANNAEEHEVVLAGTKDKWLWDAWRNRSPDLKDVPIADSAKKAETQKLVIDLQAEDRGKPHWMSTVDWSKVD